MKAAGTSVELYNSPKTITCSAPANSSYGGWLDGADCNGIGGWAWDANQPNTPIYVGIYDGNTLIATVPANQFRQDLLNAGIGNGYHGFSIATPASLKNGAVHTIHVKFAGTTTDLSGSPKTVTCGNYTYDAAGNVTNDVQHTFQYDGENRLVSVDSGATASYAYDHQNRRYKTTAGSTVTHYVWQGEKVLAEHNGSTGAVLVNYIYAGSRMIAKIAGSTTTYFLNDQLSARLMMNTSGAVIGRQGHLPFGEDFAESDTQQKQHFTSYERDPQSGTDYAMNRTYSFGVGRFQSADPFQSSDDGSVPQSWNRYAYVTNAPTGYIDPMGLMIGVPNPGDICGGVVPGPGGDAPPPPNCVISVYDRLTEFGGGLPLPGNRHGYIIFTDNVGEQHYFEGKKDQKTKQLTAVESDPQNKALPHDHPEIDRFDGGTSGPDVCVWLDTLRHDVDVVNAANIRYKTLGPNSTSVLRYMLQSLPDPSHLSWFHKPFMVGYGSRLPGVE